MKSKFKNNIFDFLFVYFFSLLSLSTLLLLVIYYFQGRFDYGIFVLGIIQSSILSIVTALIGLCFKNTSFLLKAIFGIVFSPVLAAAIIYFKIH